MSLLTEYSIHGTPAYIDSDLESTLAFRELENGLRSQRIGEQSEAIVRYPRLFAKYPFPALINTAMLKLAEVFRQGSNFLKLCVLRVVEESERHLDKMISVDELVKQLITVMNSNDPVARALTLRTLGSMACILKEKKQVHHKIRASLDSQDTVEVEAAIYAAKRYCEASKAFSVDICHKLLDMISGYATPIQVKLKIIRIFENMHHDAPTASYVREACESLLPSYPGHEFLLTTLHTLTSLASRTLVHIPQHVSLLLSYLNSDPRTRVQMRVLSDLQLLTEQETAHLWTRENIETMIDYTQTVEDTRTRVASFNLLISLIEAGGIYQVELGPGAPVLSLCEANCYSGQLSTAAAATQLLIQLAISCYKENISPPETDILGSAMLAIESLCLFVSSGDPSGDPSAVSSVDGQHDNGLWSLDGCVSSPKDLIYFKRALKAAVSLCSTQPRATSQLVDILGVMMTRPLALPVNDMSVAVCETLTALGSLNQEVLSSLVPDLCHLSASLIEESRNEKSNKFQEKRTRILSTINTMFLQTLRGFQWPEECRETLLSSLKVLDKWQCYRIARNAARYGHHWVSCTIYKDLKSQVSTEPLFHWLQGLELFSEAEESLSRQDNKTLQERLSRSITIYQRGISALSAASTGQHNMSFQIEFLRCRVQFLQTLWQLVAAGTSLRTSPPPAIAAALAAQTRDELQRCGRVTPQLRQAAKDLKNCGERWGKLAESCFDADPVSLAQLMILRQAMESLSMWLEMVCLKSNLQGSMYTDTEVKFSPSMPEDLESTPTELLSLINTMQLVAEEFKAIHEDPEAKPISHLHTACIFQSVRILNSAPLPYPRFFFQSLQETRIKLAVSPKLRSPGEPVQVNTSQFLAIKVEGVLERDGLETNRSRKVSQVEVELVYCLQPSTTKPQMEKEGEQLSNSSCLTQAADISNDFFTAQFLVPFGQVGLYSVNIEARLVDSEGQRWRTEAKVNLTVKSFEDRATTARNLAR